MSPSKFFDDIHLYEPENYGREYFNFESKTGLKDFFYNLNILLNEKKVTSFEKIIKMNFVKILSANRFLQFKNYWLELLIRREFEISNSLKKFVSCRIELYEYFNFSGEISIREIECVLSTYPRNIIFNLNSLPLFQKYIEMIKKRSEYLKKHQSIYCSKVILLSLYAIFLNDMISENELQQVFQILHPDHSSGTKQKLASYIGLEYAHNEKEIKKQNIGLGPSNLLYKNKQAADNGFNLFEFEIRNNFKMRINHENNESREIDLLQYYIVNQDYISAIKYFENEIMNGHETKKLLAYYIEALFRLDDLIGLKVFLKNFDMSSSSIAYYYIIVLRKLLLRSQKFKESRSVDKLIRKISD